MIFSGELIWHLFKTAMILGSDCTCLNQHPVHDQILTGQKMTKQKLFEKMGI